MVQYGWKKLKFKSIVSPFFQSQLPKPTLRFLRLDTQQLNFPLLRWNRLQIFRSSTWWQLRGFYCCWIKRFELLKGLRTWKRLCIFKSRFKMLSVIGDCISWNIKEFYVFNIWLAKLNNATGVWISFWESFTLWRLFRRANLLMVPPIPSHGPLIWDVAKNVILHVN